MRAARYTRSGPAGEVIEVTDVEAPDPGPGEVRVRVAFSGVNPTDWKSRSGATAGTAFGPDGQVPDQDGSGTGEAGGPGAGPGPAGARGGGPGAARHPPRGPAAG